MVGRCAIARTNIETEIPKKKWEIRARVESGSTTRSAYSHAMIIEGTHRTKGGYDMEK